MPEADGAIDEGGRAIGYRTLGRVIEEMNKCGFAARFRVTGSQVRALESGRTFDTEDLTIREY